jgi:hypothetical protein
MSRQRTVALDNTFNVTFLTGLEKFVKPVKSKCETFFKRFGSFRDVLSNNKILYPTRFWVNWAFLIALEALKPSLRSCFNLVPRAIRKAQFTQKLVAQITIVGGVNLQHMCVRKPLLEGLLVPFSQFTLAVVGKSS